MTNAKSKGIGIDAVGTPVDFGRVTLYHPTTDEPLVDGQGNVMWVEVYGQDSKHYKQVQHNQTNRRLQKAQRSGGRASVTAEQQEAMAHDLLAKCTKDWHIILDDQAPECTEEQVREIYQNYPWVRDQVDAFMHDRKAFLKT